MAKHLIKKNVGAQPPDVWHLSKLVDCGGPGGTDDHLDYRVDCYECGECTPCGSALPEGGQCDHSPETCCTPIQWDILIAGVVLLPSGCFVCSTGDFPASMQEVVDPGVNGQHFLEQTTSCAWAKTLGPGGVDHDGTHEECSNLHTGSETVTITLTRAATSYLLTVSGFGASGTVSFFSSSVTSVDADRCDQSKVFENLRTAYACDHGDGDTFPAKDGTATAYPCNAP